MGVVLHKRKGTGKCSQINNRGSGLLKGSLGIIIIGGVTHTRKTLVEGTINSIVGENENLEKKNSSWSFFK